MKFVTLQVRKYFQTFKFSNFQIFPINTHCECVFFDPTQQQGASKLQARKPPF
jgi:hypothetical protein